MIGEDTVLGNLNFIEDASESRLIGSGIILYTQDWRYRYNSVEETTRSVGDISALGQAKMWGAVPFGYHGSHFIVRADVENKIGWDFGEARSEDLHFWLQLRKRYGLVARPLKGFAYEKPPLTFTDHLKQRRRWILGSLEVLNRSDNPIRFKAPLIYGLLSWLSALPSLAAAILSLIRPTGGVIDYLGGLIAGFTWWSIVNNYLVGLEIHEVYVEKQVSRKLLIVIWSAALGILADAVSPWYALIWRTKGYDEVRKDTRINPA
jgi:cellulose synthase/poly-beta-1,6-N-acetylglucosamine synthase-like glycosyltransferase